MATQLQGIYKCSICGNVVEVLHAGAGELVCCGQPMAYLAENTTDAAQEKHVPVISIGENSISVKVGSVAHPMTAEHSIEWIELIADGKSYRAFLQPGDAPEATFAVKAQTVSARAYCNLHAMWKS